MISIPRGAWFLLLLPCAAHGAAKAPPSARGPYDITPVPAWVQRIEPAASAQPTGGAQASNYSVEYLLVDHQARTGEDAQSYSRYVERLLNPLGVSQESQISINFDPVRGRLHVHEVKLRRGDQVIDELKHGRIEVLRRETSLEDNLLDGSLTFHLIMSDVRVGDVIEYSYTIDRRNAEWGNRSFGQYNSQWSVPVSRLHLKLLGHSLDTLHILGNKTEPARRVESGWQVMEWNGRDVPALPNEGDVPEWREQYPTVQYSQFSSWQELVAAATPLYAVQNPLSPELRAMTERMRAAAPDDAGRALAVMHFVQDDVRYTGLEQGGGAYRPRPPGEVLKRRYGDCKDKTLLAVTLLRNLGIEAAPALVSTRWQGQTSTRLPSPGDFDHAIVKATIGGRPYWFDATETAQGGDLEHFVQADLGQALVIAPGSDAPQAIPAYVSKAPLILTTVLFDFGQDVHAETGLAVSSTYRGLEADHMRRTLRGTTLEELGKDYLTYYRQRYSGIRADAPLHVTDNLKANELTIDESYRIEHAFEDNGKGKLVFELEADGVADHVKAPRYPVRTMPMALAHPVDNFEQIRIRMPQNFPVKDDVQTVDAPAFRYDSRVSHDGNDVTLEYHYKTLAAEVPRADLDNFLKMRAKVHDDLNFQFTIDSDQHQRDERVAKTLKDLRDAAGLAKSGKFADADKILQGLIDSSGYLDLSAEQQHAALLLAGNVALVQGSSHRALALLQRSSAMAPADENDWTLRFMAAGQDADKGDSTLALTTLAQRWPATLPTIDAPLVAAVLRDTPKAGTTRYTLLKALFDSRFSTDAFDVSGWWGELALLQLERGENADAISSLRSVTDPYVIIGIHADNRFDPVRAQLDRVLDVNAAIAKELEHERDVVKRKPGELMPLLAQAYTMRNTLQFTEALQLLDSAIAKASGPEAKKQFSDRDRYFVWLLDTRSQALADLGRWDDAVNQELTASHLSEYSGGNVSQIINLANLYDDLGRAQDAKRTLVGLAPSGASGYGNMQVAIEKMRIALQLGDQPEAARQLEYLRAHQTDSESTYQNALIFADHADEAAKVLMDRLANPEQRADALLEVQHYRRSARDELLKDFSSRWEAVLARTDVRAAIDKVGRVESYPLLRQAH